MPTRSEPAGAAGSSTAVSRWVKPASSSGAPAACRLVNLAPFVGNRGHAVLTAPAQDPEPVVLVTVIERRVVGTVEDGHAEDIGAGQQGERAVLQSYPTRTQRGRHLQPVDRRVGAVH